MYRAHYETAALSLKPVRGERPPELSSTHIGGASSGSAGEAGAPGGVDFSGESEEALLLNVEMLDELYAADEKSAPNLARLLMNASTIK